jgi:hypothetical protein
VAGVVAGVTLIAVGAWGVAGHHARLPTAGPPPHLGAATQGPAPAGSGPPAASSPTRVRTVPRQDRRTPGSAVSSTTTVPQLSPGASRVVIPSLQIDAAVTAVTESPVGALGVPDDPTTLGWWMPEPSVLVLDGHVDSALTGPGALFELRDLKPGAEIVVDPPSGGPERWHLDGLRTYVKGHLPVALFYQPGPRLVIVTCGGPFDYATHHYYDNVVAYASPS